MKKTGVKCAQNFNEKIAKIGLRPPDLPSEVCNEEELIRHISGSAIMYYTVMRHIILNRASAYFQQPSIQLSDRVDQYIKRKSRKILWSDFARSMDLSIPGLKLNLLAWILLIIHVVIFWGMISLLNTEILSFRLSGLGMGPIWSAILLLPIGLIFMYGTTKLPGKDFNELTDKIIARNTKSLLCDNKKKFIALLHEELS